MPYLSHNYRYQPKPRSKSFVDAMLFVTFSALSIFVMLVILGWLSTVSAATGINPQLTYQGKLNDSTGEAVADASYDLKFVLYDASSGGTCLWTAVGSCADATYSSVSVSTVNGVFSVVLGASGQNSIATSSVDFNTDSLYLGVTVESDVEMTPRKRLTASPYAFNADLVDGFSATSTASVANSLLALDSSGNLNLFNRGVSSTNATTTALFLVPQSSAPDSVEGRLYYDAAANTLYVYNGSSWQDVLGTTINDWEYGVDSTYITPTSTTVGLLINASSTIAANFRVDGNATTTGTQYATQLGVGSDYITDLSGNGLTVSSGGLQINYANINTWTALNTFSDLRVTALNASSTANFANLFVYGSATTTGVLNVSEYASTTNLVLGPNGSNLSSFNDLYVSSGDLFFDGTQLTGSGGLSLWQYTFDGNLTPTSSSAGLYVTASSTIAANFRVDGNSVVTGNATTTGYLVVGAPTWNYVNGAGDLIVSDDIEIDDDLYVADDVTIAGDILASDFHVYSVERTMPAVNNYVDIGTFSFTNGTGNLAVSVAVEISGTSISKQYLLPVQYDTSGWYITRPISSTGVYDNNKDFDLDINVSGTSVTLRLRPTNTGGTGVSANAHIVIKQEGSAADTFTPSSTTGAVTAPTAYFEATPLTQVDSKVGIGTSAPAYTLEISNMTATTTLYIVGNSRFEGSVTTTSKLVVGNSNPTIDNYAIHASSTAAGANAYGVYGTAKSITGSAGSPYGGYFLANAETTNSSAYGIYASTQALSGGDTQYYGAYINVVDNGAYGYALFVDANENDNDDYGIYVDSESTAVGGGLYVLDGSTFLADDVYIGAESESIGLTGFDFDGDDLYVEGELGINSDAFFDANLQIAGNATTSGTLQVVTSLATGTAQPNSTTTANFGGNILIQGSATTTGRLSIGGEPSLAPADAFIKIGNITNNNQAGVSAAIQLPLAGSTVYGFKTTINSDQAGGATSYGYYSDITASDGGTATYQFYAGGDGSATNYYSFYATDGAGPAVFLDGAQIGENLTFDSEIFDSFTDDATLANNSGDLQVVDVNCTDCIGAGEISDIYVLNTGDTITGTLTVGDTDDDLLVADGYLEVCDGGVGCSNSFATDGDLFVEGNATTTKNLHLSSSTSRLSIGTSSLSRVGVFLSPTFTDTATDVYGFNSSATVNGSNTSYRGFYDSVTVGAGATITTRYGAYILDPIGTGAVTNNYGIYVANQTKGGTADYGMYIQGGDTYALYVESDSSFFGGTVNIDANSNSSALRLYGADAAAEIADFYVNSSGQLTLDVTAGTDSQAHIDIRGEDDQYGVIIRESDGTSAVPYANLYMTDNGTDDYFTITVDAVQSTSALVVDQNNNVGIGTNPDYKLHVSGNSYFSGSATTTGTLQAVTALATGTARPNSTTTANFGGNVLIQGQATTTKRLTVANNGADAQTRYFELTAVPGGATDTGFVFGGSEATEAVGNLIVWTDEANILASDSSYASQVHDGTCSAADYLIITNFGLSIPSTATITGIEAVVNYYTDNPQGSTNLLGNLTKDGTGNNTADYTGGFGSGGPPGVDKTLGGAGDLWSNTWTPTEVNATNFGLAIQSVDAGCVAATIYFDYVKIKVYYTTVDSNSSTAWSTGYDYSANGFSISRGNILGTNEAMSISSSNNFIFNGSATSTGTVYSGQRLAVQDYATVPADIDLFGGGTAPRLLTASTTYSSAVGIGAYINAVGMGTPGPAVSLIARGESQSSSASAYGIRALGKTSGSSSNAYGVYGEGNGASGTTAAYGVYGIADTAGTTNYGIYGTASGATTNYAGYFAAGAVAALDDLYVGDTTEAIGDSDFNLDGDDLYLNGELGVNSTAYFDLNIEIGGNAANDDDFIYFDQGNESISWDDVPGEFDVSDDLNVTGNATTSGTLQVVTSLATGTAQPNSTTTANFGGGVLIQGSATTTARLTVGSTNPTVNAGLFASAGTTSYAGYFSGNLYVSGNATTSGTLQVVTSLATGTAQPNSTTTANFGGNIAVQGYATTTTGLYTQSSGHFGGSLTVDSTLGIATASASEILHVGAGIPTTSGLAAYLANATVGGAFIDSSLGHSRVTLEGSTSAAIDLLDSGGGTNEKWMQLIIQDNITYFRSFTDAAAVQADNILVMDNGTGYVGINEATPDYRLDVYTSHANGYAAEFFNDNNAQTGYGIKVQAGEDAGAGTLVDWFDGDGTSIGAVTFSGGTVTYGQFTGAHFASVPEADNAQGYEYGAIVCLIETTFDPERPAQPLYTVAPCDESYAANIFGAYSNKQTARENLHSISAVGDGYVLISDENGAIEPGDKITSSTLRGVGMKATQHGPMVGVALAAWDSGDATETRTLPNGQVVTVGLVAVNYYPGLDFVPATQLAVTESPDGNDTTPLLVIDNPDVDVLTLVVREAAIFYGTITIIGEANFEHQVVFKADVDVEGKLYLSKDQVGTLIIPANATSTEVIFEGEFKNTPKIIATLNELVSLVFAVTSKTTTGFRLSLLQTINEPVSFDWVAFAPAGDPEEQGEIPTINSITSTHTEAYPGDEVTLQAFVTDSDTTDGALTYQWQVAPGVGTLNENDTSKITWVVGEVTQDTNVTISLVVSDGTNQQTTTKVVTVHPALLGDTEPPIVITGCTDAQADNYNNQATDDDGSCVYSEPVVNQPTSTSTEEIAQEDNLISRN